MNFILKRFANAKDYTYGLLYEEGKEYPECFTLEDEGREIKIPGETRIPAGTYEIILNKELTGLTKKYRAKFNWFGWHLMLKDVSGFSGIYVHIGNTDKDTAGCILVGNICDLIPLYGNKHGYISESTLAFKSLYEKISGYLINNVSCFIKIIDFEKSF